MLLSWAFLQRASMIASASSLHDHALDSIHMHAHFTIPTKSSLSSSSLVLFLSWYLHQGRRVAHHCFSTVKSHVTGMHVLAGLTVEARGRVACGDDRQPHTPHPLVDGEGTRAARSGLESAPRVAHRAQGHLRPRACLEALGYGARFLQVTPRVPTLSAEEQ